VNFGIGLALLAEPQSYSESCLGYCFPNRF
jgi:hypothetical protein